MREGGGDDKACDRMSGSERLVIITSMAAMGIGCGLLIAAMAIPPPGEIHNSVLVAFGEITTFAGTLLGIRKRPKT